MRNIFPVYQDSISSDYSRFDYFFLACILVSGTILRFWGLGNVGLHGDEETMAMPALQILESGSPLLPSGMLYPRAVSQLYLIASSVWIFGHSEWALRFPSAVVGSATIIVAFFLGKRFLPPKWNILFVLAIALLPSMITVSQTARMYIFFSTFVMLYAVLIFRWEEKGSWGSLIAAFVVFLIALEFHLLTIFAAALFLFPSLTKPSRKTFAQSGLAFVLAGVVFFLFRAWHRSQYGERLSTRLTLVDDILSPLQFLLTHHPWALGLGLFVFVIGFALMLYYQKSTGRMPLAAIALFLAAGLAFLTLNYHVGIILLGCGALLYVRSDSRPFGPAVLLGFLTVLLTAQLYFLYESNLFPGRKLIGALVGTPSVWPYLRFAEYFPLAFVLYAIPFLYAAMKLAKGSKIPDHFLFFILAVWVPLFMIGFFKWNIPSRYTFGVLPFFMLACTAGVYYVCKDAKPISNIEGSIYKYLAVPLLLVAFVNPIELAKSVNADYSKFPDHKGAASFMKTVHLDPSDIVVAEDVLQQTYYLGKVDYWLRAVKDASKAVREKNGVLYDIRTGTPLIGSGEELEKLLQKTDRASVYIIGSGETFRNRSYFLGNGILEIINLHKPQIVYKGRDDKTLVWYFPAQST